METKDLALLAVTLLILGEVTFLLAKLPKQHSKLKAHSVLVDTSVLMDGRITSIAATGFIGGTLVIPRSVVGELQFLADNADADKRARARAGLDVVTELQRMPGVEVELLQDGSKADEGVDERLLALAKQHGASICTIDFNLNKVAVVEGIRVLNINELAQSMRMSYLPGEQMLIDLVQKGQDSHQGVGYLPDGTMVVVEQASGQIGQQVHVEVVRSLQTAAGRMMFARKVSTGKPADQRPLPASVGAKYAHHKSTDRPSPVRRTRQAPKQQDSHNHTDQVSSSTSTRQAPRAAQQRASGGSRQRTRGGRVDHEANLVELANKSPQ